MLKTLTTTAAAAALLTSVAAAQTPAPPATQMPSASTKQVLTEQQADQMLASKFNGTDIIGSNNEKIGDVNDVLFDKGGKVLAYVIEVGGFLGIGSKHVALSPTSIQVQPATDREDMKLKLSMTKDQLKQMAEFKQRKDPGQATTGQAPASRAPATPPAR